MKIRGTPEQRRALRTKRTSLRRVGHYLGLMRQAAGRPRQQLSHACDYLRAVANDLPEPQVTGLAKAVTELADRWNRHDHGE